MSRKLWFVPLLLAASVALADETPETKRAPDAEAEPAAETTEAPEQTDNGAKVISGMSILGNQEAPKSLVIVPWKSSELGDSLGIETMLDDSRRPVDKDVFMRALNYYEIRSETKP